MSEVVYAVRISHLEYSGLKIMDIKIGKSTDIETTLRQYSRGNRDIELLDMWTPNPDKTLSTAERGVHAVADLPVELAHIVLSHSPRTNVEPAFVEAEIVKRADEVAAAAIKADAVGDLRNA